MNLEKLKKLVAKGEDSRLQFKEDITNGDQLAAEMVALANAEGGQLLLGVDKNGKIKGFSSKDVERVNQLKPKRSQRGITESCGSRDEMSVSSKEIFTPIKISKKGNAHEKESHITR